MAEKPRSIKIINEPLPNVLQKVTNLSGIHFKVSDTLIGETITAKIHDSSWDAVVLKLLDSFNLVELRDGNGKLIKVHVLGWKSREFAAKVDKETVSIKKRPLKKSEISLASEQLQELAQGPFRSPLPAYMLHDFGLKDFLSLHGISSDEDMKNIPKAMRVRVAARRQLKMLQEK